jgi:HPr kinase/phosphorylase
MTAADVTVHASCVVIGEAGVLVRGPSGSGKSVLVRELILEAQALGRFARLVCDDRVRLGNRNGRLVASVLPAIAGRLEARGLGLLPVAYERAAVVRLVVDCLTEPPQRLPPPADRLTRICGVALPRIAAKLEPALSRLLLLRLGDLEATLVTE